MHSKSDNIEIMINNEADEVTKNLKRYKTHLKHSKKIDKRKWVCIWLFSFIAL